MRNVLFLITLGWVLPTWGLAQDSYTSWIVGDTADVQADVLPGVVLAGGGGDNDQAMQWMLQRAGGGDVLVLRASNSDGYNDYFFSELGVDVHSVETIRFNSPAAATDPYVLRRIGEAELVFMAGGDQYDYYTYWKDTPVEDSLNQLILDKGITLGGTSAGMAILGQAYYAPAALGITSEEALSDPYHPFMDTLGYDDFLQMPYLQGLVTDTHFEQRDRQGRTLVFMARLAERIQARSYAIACNDYTAVAVDENGLARAFGEYPEYPEDQVFFLQANCQDDFLPEVLNKGEPLSWERQGAAVKVYRVPATENGEHTFDLTDWQTASGGNWENWYVEDGVRKRQADADPACDGLVSIFDLQPAGQRLDLWPNPASRYIRWQTPEDQPARQLRLWNTQGQLLLDIRVDRPELSVNALPPGLYRLELVGRKVVYRASFLKTP